MQLKLYLTWTLLNWTELQCTLYFTAICNANMQCIAPRSSVCFSQCTALHLSELLCSAMSCWDILVHCWISCITGRNIPWGGLAANAGVGDIWDQFSTQDSTVSHQSPLDQAFDFNTSPICYHSISRNLGRWIHLHWLVNMERFIKFQISGYFEPILCRIASLAFIGSDHAFF